LLSYNGHLKFFTLGPDIRNRRLDIEHQVILHSVQLSFTNSLQFLLYAPKRFTLALYRKQ